MYKRQTDNTGLQAIVRDAAVVGDITNACPTDLAPAFGVLTSSDVLEAIMRVEAEDNTVDLAAPLDEYDFFDLLEYLERFDAGCP